MRVAIIGCGTAGPASAMMLAKQGHEVHLFERADKLLPIGAGFMLQPTGMSVLKHMGILEEVLENTDQIDSLFCKTPKGKVLLDLKYQELQSGLFGAGTHRASFLKSLMKACDKVGVTTHFNSPVDDISLSNNKRNVSYQGNSYGEFDLVIVADGSRSQLRDQLNIKARCKKYPWGALWFIGERPESFKSNQLWQVVQGTSTLNGFLPTGTKDNLLSFFYSIELNQIASWRQSKLTDWKDSILRTTPEAEPFLEQIHDHQQISSAAYYDVTMPHWHDERAVILGDAAHALSPQLGQGVNLALMDSLVLCQCIEQEKNLATALALYSSTRRQHTKFYQFATRAATPFFQSNYEILGTLRDLGFPIGHRFKWIRQQMTASMAGTKTSMLGRMKLDL